VNDYYPCYIKRKSDIKTPRTADGNSATSVGKFTNLILIDGSVVIISHKRLRQGGGREV